jgi:hypothetical protein
LAISGRISAAEAAHITTQRTILLHKLPGFWDAKEVVKEYLLIKDEFNSCSHDWQLVVFLAMFFAALFFILGLVAIVHGIRASGLAMLIGGGTTFFLPALIAFEATNTCEQVVNAAAQSPPAIFEFFLKSGLTQPPVIDGQQLPSTVINVDGSGQSDNSALTDGRDKLLAYMDTNPVQFTLFGIVFNKRSIRALASLFSSGGAFAIIYAQYQGGFA